MRTFVTGASGFVGTALCAALRAAGHEPVPVSLRLGTPRFDGAQAVVHLAGLAHRRGVDRRELERVNVGLSEEVGRGAAAAGAPLVFVSSVKVHGEESAAPLDERAPIAPRDAYAASKARAEERLRAIAGLRLTVLRPPLVYGPGVKANFLALLRAIDRGLPLPFAAIANRRSLVYVGNLADAILRCMASPQAAGRTYLVADGAALSTPELCREIARALGRPARLFAIPAGLLELVPGVRRLTRSLEVDDGALRRELGWRAPATLAQGLAATADWTRALE
ncbi:MAG TPA: NAD-dependent epimerase/dehydratase family protein [Burkholderiales bacterium]